jgi:hypothetical protein
LDNKTPVLKVSWDSKKLDISGFEVAEELGRNKPRIAVWAEDGSNGESFFNITTGQMQPGEEKIVAERVYAIFSKKRIPKSESMTGPAANLSGLWDLSIQFFSSVSQHSLSIVQDGNWLSGAHQTDFQSGRMSGTIEGNRVMMQSAMRIVGDDLTYQFSGLVNGDMISGDIHLGEYRTAKFTAKRNEQKVPRRKVNIPAGPPLAT